MTLVYIFDCALNGPFDNLFLTWLSAPQVLCKGIIAVISASTVYEYSISHIIPPSLYFVNRFGNFFLFLFYAEGDKVCIILPSPPVHTGGDNSITFRYIPTTINCGSWPVHDESASKTAYNNSVFIIPQNLSDFNIWTGFAENFVKEQSVDL